MRYRYTVVDRTGQRMDGTIESASITEAELVLVRRFTNVEKLEPLETEGAREASAPRKAGRLSPDLQALLLRQLATMLRSGIPLHRAVRLAAQDSSPRLQALLTEIEARLSGGWALSDCFRRSGAMPALVVNVVAAGEESGTLEEGLEKLASIAERSVTLRKKLIASLAYPATLLTVALAAVAVFAFYLIPQMQQIYIAIGGTLPLPTRMLVAGVALASSPVTWVIVGGCAAAMLALVRGAMTVKTVRYRVDGCILQIPVVGPLVVKVGASRMLHALATTLDAGLPLSGQIGMLEGLAGNMVIEVRLREARRQLDAGAMVHEAFEGAQVFSRLVIQMMRAGEESGNLPDMLRRSAEIYEEEVDVALATAATLVEPLLLIVMGLVVGFIALAACLPIIRLLDQL